jgi:hypothetical protein
MTIDFHFNSSKLHIPSMSSYFHDSQKIDTQRRDYSWRLWSITFQHPLALIHFKAPSEPSLMIALLKRMVRHSQVFANPSSTYYLHSHDSSHPSYICTFLIIIFILYYYWLWCFDYFDMSTRIKSPWSICSSIRDKIHVTHHTPFSFWSYFFSSITSFVIWHTWYTNRIFIHIAYLEKSVFSIIL